MSNRSSSFREVWSEDMRLKELKLSGLVAGESDAKFYRLQHL